jgi:hypothetical protein
MILLHPAFWRPDERARARGSTRERKARPGRRAHVPRCGWGLCVAQGVSQMPVLRMSLGELLMPGAGKWPPGGGPGCGDDTRRRASGASPTLAEEQARPW